MTLFASDDLDINGTLTVVSGTLDVDSQNC